MDKMSADAKRRAKERREDWNDRQFMTKITAQVSGIVRYLNRFDTHCRAKLVKFEGQLTRIERLTDQLDNLVSQRLADQQEVAAKRKLGSRHTGYHQGNSIDSDVILVSFYCHFCVIFGSFGLFFHVVMI